MVPLAIKERIHVFTSHSDQIQSNHTIIRKFPQSYYLEKGTQKEKRQLCRRFWARREFTSCIAQDIKGYFKLHL
uniref:Uncharacterized protein n=1 Tax=Rhizophora mucronata TaxID=61149 RepID=A0A2P2Q8K6_RHIMU